MDNDDTYDPNRQQLPSQYGRGRQLPFRFKFRFWLRFRRDPAVASSASIAVVTLTPVQRERQVPREDQVEIDGDEIEGDESKGNESEVDASEIIDGIELYEGINIGRLHASRKSKNKKLAGVLGVRG